jgi:AcrR family transcriptional regulator
MSIESTTRRTRARRGQGERLREEILEAAERLLLETGDADAVSIRAVANAVGVTPPSIYLHFADKTELIFEVCQVQWGRFDEALRRATEDVDDPIERLRACGRAYVDFGLRNPAQYRTLFMGKPQETPPGVDMEKVLAESGFARLGDYVGEALESGRIVGDPNLIIFHAWSSVHGITSLLLAHPDMPWPDRDALVEQILDGTFASLRPG